MTLVVYLVVILIVNLIIYLVIIGINLFVPLNFGSFWKVRPTYVYTSYSIISIFFGSSSISA